MKTIKYKPILDIFSKRKEPVKNIEKPKIIVDYREKNSLVASELFHLGFEIEFKELKVGDYLIKNIAIERKTISDFINSMINKRLINQIENLQQYPDKLLIIEGIDEQELYNDDNTQFQSEAIKKTAFQYQEGKSKKTAGCFPNANAIRGFILSIVLKHKIPTILTKDYKDTAKFIYILSKKQEKEQGINPKKRARNVKEQTQYILEGFPGIGPKGAKKLLKEFGSIKNIINADLEKLKKILGKKAETMKKIIENSYP